MNNSNMQQRQRVYDTLQTRFGLRITARLQESTRTLAPEIEERLRFGRERALERARASTPAAVSVTASGMAGTLTFSRSGPSGVPWWGRLAALVPLALLIVGLTAIQQRHSQTQIEAAAEIDAAILADDLPPAAYSDPGFAAYLRAPQD